MAGSGMGGAGSGGEEGWWHAEFCEDMFAGRLANDFSQGCLGKFADCFGPLALGVFQDEGAADSEMGGNGVGARATERRSEGAKGWWGGCVNGEGRRWG